MQLEVFIPTGSGLGSNQFPHGQRLEDLNGKIIGEISNGVWSSDRILPLIRDLLKKRYPDIRFVPYTELPSGVDGIMDNEELGELVLAKGCDAVIGASAG